MPVFGTNGEYRTLLTWRSITVMTCKSVTRSRAAAYPAVFVTGRQSTDPAGTLQSEVQMKAGEITYASFESSAPRRWGDYTEMTIAPNGTTCSGILVNTVKTREQAMDAGNLHWLLQL